MGHNLCLDVFGGQTDAEVSAPIPGSAGPPVISGLHGEAGACSWDVVHKHQDADGASVTLAAHLRRTCLEVQRTFSVTAGGDAVRVDETIVNLVGFQRALGCANHITLGEGFLKSGSTRFACNADKGQVILPAAPGVSNEGRSSPLLVPLPPFFGPGFRLGACWNRLVEAVKTRKKRDKTGEKWARYGLKGVKEGS